MGSFVFLAGLTVGAAIWAVATFATFHLLRAAGKLQSEAAWGLVQGVTTLILVGCAVLLAVLARGSQ